MKSTHRFLAATLLSAVCTVSAWAGASRDDAVAQVNAAIGHIKKVGAEQAVKDVNTAPQWKVNGMNVIINHMKGDVLASSLNDKLVGKNTLESKDPSGKAFVKDFVATAQKGEGWVDYQFINPASKKLEERSMFVKKAPGMDGFVGVAITKE
ncbi:MAG: cache domain-containing protein [Aquabacterium sp.]|nr:cache domain-containing protein [Aquabacterium sp.]